MTPPAAQRAAAPPPAPRRVRGAPLAFVLKRRADKTRRRRRTAMNCWRRGAVLNARRQRECAAANAPTSAGSARGADKGARNDVARSPDKTAGAQRNGDGKRCAVILLRVRAFDLRFRHAGVDIPTRRSAARACEARGAICCAMPTFAGADIYFCAR